MFRYVCDMPHSHVSYEKLIDVTGILVATTHCNTLQHTATHCNTLCCSVLQCVVRTCRVTWIEHTELPLRLLDYFLRSNKSNINQYMLTHMTRMLVATKHLNALQRAATHCHTLCCSMLHCVVRTCRIT